MTIGELSDLRADVLVLAEYLPFVPKLRELLLKCAEALTDHINLRLHVEASK